MFRTSSLSHRIISVSLPFVFLLAWVACVATCTEASAAHEDQNSSWAAKSEGAIGVIKTSHCSENCFLTSPAAFQERQNAVTPALLAEKVFLLPSRNLVAVNSIAGSDINQNSPPEKSPPLYLLLCNFRI
jgi:hypothetical protein